MHNVMVFGATSAIATETARIFAARGDRLFLLARDTAKLEAVADDLRIRGADRVDTRVVDADDVARHEEAIDEVWKQYDGLDVVLIAHGTLPDQSDCEATYEATAKAMMTNCLSTMSLLTVLANRLSAQGTGTICVISSVAGDRGRQSNYVYGSAKAAISTFLQGLRNRLYRSGVHVVTVKPGLVDTPMTAAFPKGLLWAQPGSIARGIVRAIGRRRNVVYVPGFWRLIMFVIRSIPENLFKRLRL